MDFYAQIFSNEWLWVGNFIFAYIFAKAVWTAPWQALWRNNQQFTVLIGLSLGLMGLWLLPVGLRDGLTLHLLGATLCVLMFDWQIALVMLTGMMLIELVKHDGSLLVTGSNGIVMIALPIMATRLFFRLFQRYGIKSYFSFIWWNGYICGFLSMVLVGFANALLIGAFGHYSWFIFKQDYLSFLPILSASESVVTGVFISGFAVFLPNAVAYFDQDIYFAKKPPG
ncbi:MAG: energy-coupling factor ABC transporter permease [Gallionella sp.]